MVMDMVDMAMDMDMERGKPPLAIIIMVMVDMVMDMDLDMDMERGKPPPAIIIMVMVDMSWIWLWIPWLSSIYLLVSQNFVAFIGICWNLLSRNTDLYLKRIKIHSL